MARKTQDEIVADVLNKIETLFDQDQPLHDRMDMDYSSWRLTHFVPDEEEGVDPEDAYTTNSLRTLADKIESFISGSEQVVRVHNDAADEQKRAANDNLERLVIGMHRQINKRLQRKGEPLLVSQLAWYSTVRGGRIAARSLLRKKPNGDTFAEIKPLDPRHLVVQYGEEEPIFAAYRMTQTRSEIRDTYKNFKFYDVTLDDGHEVEFVYDCYERQIVNGEVKYMNYVIIDDHYAKKPADTFAMMFPICTVPVGSVPLLATSDTGMRQIDSMADIEDPIKDFSESIFAPNRDIIKFKNRVFSYRMALAARAVDQAYKVSSLDGTKALEDNPSKKGSQINVSTQNQEDVQPLPLSQSPRDADVLLGAINDDEVDGGLPPQAFGILQAPISGYAMRQLGTNIEQKVIPRLTAVQNLLEMSFEHLIMMYETKSYKDLNVSGKTYAKMPFDGPIKPDDIKNHGDLTFTLLPALPEDDMQRYSIAQMATQPTATGESLVSMDFARDRILRMQDADLERQRIYEQIARTSTPIMQLVQLYTAAMKSGDEQMAQHYLQEIKLAEEQKQMQELAQRMTFMQQYGQMQQPMAPPQPGAPTSNGVRPEVMPNAAMGGIPNTPSPNQGNNTAAPRPGAQSERTQLLRSIGLEEE